MHMFSGRQWSLREPRLLTLRPTHLCRRQTRRQWQTRRRNALVRRFSLFLSKCLVKIYDSVKFREDFELNTYLVCMAAAINSVIYTCGHMCMCYECALQTKVSIFPIHSYVQVFWQSYDLKMVFILNQHATCNKYVISSWSLLWSHRISHHEKVL